MTRLILSTSNIMTSGPSLIRKPGVDRSNLEFINSLRANFRAAQIDYSPPQSATTNGAIEDDYHKVNGDANGDFHRPPASIWTTRDGNDFYIPTIDWSLSGLSEERNAYDITVKLFFLPSSAVQNRPEHTRHAISLVLKELGVDSIDLLIVSFPGMSFDGDCEWEADKLNSAQGNDDDEVQTWSAIEELHNSGTVKRLGIAEFGSEKLARFLSRVKVWPQVDQINVNHCCNVPPPLAKLAKKEGIELFTHSDCTDILPTGTLRELLGQGSGGAGILAESKRGLEGEGMKGDLQSQWVVKYTAVVRDRGVIEDKGYFAVAELDE